MKNNFLKNLIQLISLLIILTFTFFIIIPTIERFRNHITNSKDQVIDDIENALGLDISYSKISPILTSIIISEVKIKTSNGFTYVNANKLELNINILKLISKKGIDLNYINIITSLVLMNCDSNIDLNDLDFINRLPVGSESGDVLPFSIKIKGLNLDLLVDDIKLSLIDSRVRLDSKLSKYNFHILGDIEYHLKENIDLKSIKSNISFSGEANNDFTYIKSKIFCENIKSNLWKLKDQNVDFIYEKNQLKLSSNNNGLNYLLKVKPDINELFFNLDTVGISLDDLVVFNKEYVKFSDFKSIKFKGNFKGIYNYLNNSFLYSSKGSMKLNLPSNSLPINLSFNTIGDSDRITFYYINAFTNIGSASYKGSVNLKNFFPSGSLSINNLQISKGININTTIGFNILNNNYINIDFNDINIQGIEIGTLPSLLYIDNNDINLKVFKEDEDGTISISGNYDRVNNYLTSDLNIGDFDLNRFSKINILKNVFNYANPNKLSLNANVETDFNGYEFDIRDMIIWDTNERIIFESDVRGNNQNFYVDHLKMDVQDVSFVGRLEGIFNSGSISMNIDCMINDNKYLFDSVISDSEIKVIGNHGFNLNLSFGDSVYIELVTDRFPVNYKNYFFNPTINLKSILFNNNEFLISVSEFSTYINKTDSVYQPYFSFVLDGNQDRVLINQVEYIDSISTLTGSMNLTKLTSDLYNITLNLSSDDNEKYIFNTTYNNLNKNITLGLNIEHAKLQRLNIDTVVGDLSLNLNLEGSIDKFVAKGDIFTSNLEFKKNKSTIKSKFNINENLIALNEFSAEYKGRSIKIPLLTYNYREGSILGSVVGELNVDTISFVADNLLEVKILPINSIVDLSKDSFKKLNGSLSIKSLTTNGEMLFSNKVIKMFNNRSAFQLYSVDNNLKLNYSYRSGIIKAKVDKPYFASFKANGVVKDGNLDLLLNDVDIDAKLAEIYIPFTPERDRRIVEIENLDVKGQLHIGGELTTPEINGLLWASSKLDVEYVTGEIEPIRLNLRVKDSVLSILPTSIVIGNSGLINLNGEVHFDSWIPQTIILNTLIEEENKIPVTYQYDIFNVDANIYTKGLNLIWDDFTTNINGDITLVDSEFTTRIRQEIVKKEKEKEKESLGGLNVDVGVEIGKNNILYFPTKQLPIVQAIATPGDSISVKFNSVRNSFRVNGEVSVKEGAVAYSGKPFILREGNIQLNLSEENFDPQVYIVGSKSVIDNDDRKVDILLTYQGGLISGLKASWDSNPKMSEDDVLMLLGVAVTAGDREESIVEVADLATGLVAEPVENALKDILNVDYVKIDTKFLSQLFLGRNITKDSFEQEDESQYNLSEILSDTSLSIGDFITEDLFIKGKLGTVYEEDRDLEMEVDLELNLTTPHFILGISLNHMLNETYFTPELGLSLQWKWVPGELKEK